GAVLYEMLTGRAPFHGGSVLETLRQVQTREPEPPCRLRPEVPGELAAICLRCLEKDGGRRYRSAAALAEALDHFLCEDFIARKAVMPAPSAATAGSAPP